MVNRILLAELLTQSRLVDIEKHLVFSFLRQMGVPYSQSPILKSYLRGFKAKAKLLLKIDNLAMQNLKELEYLLELLIPPKDRELNGAYFTPMYIVEYIINEMKPAPNHFNLDPSCGCGSFIVGLAEYYRRVYSKPIRASVRENIFGADILDYNIRRTKLMLSILALQYGETLSNEDFNLAVQDSLRANWNEAFSRNPIGKFDNIVGNPPYVKFQDLSELNRCFLSEQWTAIRSGTFNLYFAFFEQGYNLLKDDAKLGYITPNNYFTSLSGESLREFFQNKRCVQRVVDFSHRKVFDAQTYTAITFLGKQPTAQIEFDRITHKETPEDFLSSPDFSVNLLDDLNSKKWRLLKEDEQYNIHQIESIGIPIGSLFDISVGIATLKDDVYFVDGTKRKGGVFTKIAGTREFYIEQRLTRRVFKVSDFKSQLDCDNNQRRIIFPYQVQGSLARVISQQELKTKFPKGLAYLLSERKRLESRDKGKIEVEPFYAYGRSQGLTRTGKKLLTPTFSQYPRFLIVEDSDALFCNGYGIFFKDEDTMPLTAAFINPLARAENIGVLQKLMNSFVMHYFVSCTSYSIEGGFPCYQKNFIEKFTIPDFSEKDVSFLRNATERLTVEMFLVDKYQLNIPAPNLEEYVSSN
jgi:hypothetical protein